MWNGALAPLRKHRDYQHATFFEHARDNGADIDYSPRTVWVETDPITEKGFGRSRRYYFMHFDYHQDGYLYLIPAASDGSVLSENDVSRVMDDYARNPVDGGRDVNNYLDFDFDIPQEVIDWVRDRGHGDKVDFRWQPLDTGA